MADMLSLSPKPARQEKKVKSFIQGRRARVVLQEKTAEGVIKSFFSWEGQNSFVEYNIFLLR